MKENDEAKSGRGHTGSYSTNGDILNFAIPWWVEYVSGKAMVAEKPIKARARFKVEENYLVITFEGGSVQKFKRVLPARRFSLTGGWELASYVGGGSIGPAKGQIFFGNNRFILIYTMVQKDSTLAGRAHAGKFQIEEDSLTLEVPWSLQYVSGKGSVSGRVGKREVLFSVEDETLNIKYDNGAIQKFKFLH